LPDKRKPFLFKPKDEDSAIMDEIKKEIDKETLLDHGDTDIIRHSLRYWKKHRQK